jgi:hypothetical protein
VFVCVCVCLCVRLCVSTPMHGSAGNFVGIVYGSQRVAWATLFVRARLRACAGRMRALHACTRMHIIEHILSKIGGDITWVARHNLFLRARYARGCTHMRACVRLNFVGRIICSKLGENIPLRGLHAFYVRTCVWTLCACVHCTHMRALTF